MTDSSGSGTGKTILTGANTYTGGTTISTGTLQLGNGGMSGSILGGVADNGALAFDRSDTATFAGVISGGGVVAQIGPGTTILTGANTYTGGTTISGGTLQLGNGGTTGSIVGGVADSGTLAFDRSDTATFAGVISGSGAVAQIGSGTTILTANSPYTGGTAVSEGALVVGDFAHPSAALSGGGPITVASGGALGGYGSATGSVANSGVIAAGSATPGFTDLPTGTFTINGDLVNQGLVRLGGGQSIGNVLQVAGNYLGSGGSMAVNTYLGGDGSPSDLLVISGGHATGSTSVQVTNVGGPGALTTGNGILLVNAINGATTALGAFSLAGEANAGPFEYDLFRGGVTGGSGNNWYLRSDFITPPIPPTPPTPPTPEPKPLPPAPPPNPLPPDTAFPIIGPRLATYGVVQPLARQWGLTTLGTLHERVGDTYEPDCIEPAPAAETSAVDLPTRKPDAVPTKKPGAAPCPLFSPSAWARFFGGTINNEYQAFADPRASGNLWGFQGGVDLLHGSLFAGHYERAGLYAAYGLTDVNVNGLITNPAATAYILAPTGSLDLDAWSGGAYWTHVGPGGWYLDAVLQGTSYSGHATTTISSLPTDGWGFLASLEGGYPIPLWFWPRLVLEPQGQIIWQHVGFGQNFDGIGTIGLGSTSGWTGRLGLLAESTIATGGGQVWQPYVRANLWQDWGAQAATSFSGSPIQVPLNEAATRLEFAGGGTVKVNANWSAYAQAGYQFAVGSSEVRRNGFTGDFGLRYSW